LENSLCLCENGYYSFNDYEECRLCSDAIDGCNICESEDVCTTCTATMSLVNDRCVECSDNCRYCEESDTCDFC